MTFPALATGDAIETETALAGSEEAASYALIRDRRRDGRFAQTQPIAIYEPYASRFFGGETLDISATGMKLRLPAWATLRAGRIIDLHTGTESAGLPLANRRRVMLARIVWTQLDGGDQAPHMLVGIEFLSAINAKAA